MHSPDHPKWEYLSGCLQEVVVCKKGNGGSRGGPGLPLFLDQTEARRAEKISFGDRSPPPPDDRPAPASLSEGLDPPLNRTIMGVFREVRTHLFYGK